MSTVQLLISDDGNRSAVAKLVGKRYDTLTAETLAEADLYLLDDKSIETYREQLWDRKRENGAVFCPVVLILREGTKIDQQAVSATNAEKRTVVDEVLTAPIDEETMVRRFENLLTRRDTTKNFVERNEKLEKRERELERYEAFIKESSDVVSALGADGEIQYQSPSIETVLGYEPAELIGESLFELVHPDDRETIRTQFDKLVETPEETTAVEGRFRTATGEWRWLELQGRNLLENDAISAIVTNSRDITARKEYEKRIESQRNDLQLLNQMVRHDIRNDLQVIQTHAEILETKTDDQAGESVERILTGAESAIELTREARELADVMLHSGENHEPVDISQTLIEQIDQVQSTHEPITVDIVGSLPRVSVQADEMLDSIFQNLLHNSVLHNDRAEPEVIITTEVEPAYVEVCIADNGPGVPDEQKESIFEKGEKGTDSDGSGIGLYLAETLVDQYAGEIWVEDRPDWNPPKGVDDCEQGAVFVVRLPRITDSRQ